MSAVMYLVLFIVSGAVKNIISLQVIPERANVVYVNDKYATDVILNVKRYSRRSNYYINLLGVIKHTWANNISVHFIFYEYLHNEYKRSFVEMNFKFCDFVNSDPYIGKAVANSGVVCPLAAGPINVSNITIPANDFPNVWPFERSRVEVNFKCIPAGELIGTLHVFVTFKQSIG